MEIDPDLAPVPFAPGTLARTFHPGATITYRIEAPGKPPVVLTTEFLAADESGVTMRDTTTDVEGTPQGEPETATATWKELESHAHFPRNATTIRESVVEVPAGRFETFQYRITSTTNGATSSATLWFAKNLPGPPVKVVREVDGAVAMTMVLLQTHRPPAEATADPADHGSEK